MKKQALFLLAGGLLTFAACTNDQAPAGGYTQEQVDSAVDARLAELQAQMQATNDSTINVLAQWKADSMIAAAKGQAPTTPKPRVKTPPPTTTTPTAPPPPATPTNPKDERFGGKKVDDNKDARFNEEAAKKAKEDGAKKKEDRFK